MTDRGCLCEFRSALEEVKSDLQERSQRWSRIESICGFSIMSNPGLSYLEKLLGAPSGSINSSISSKRAT